MLFAKAIIEMTKTFQQVPHDKNVYVLTLKDLDNNRIVQIPTNAEHYVKCKTGKQ